MTAYQASAFDQQAFEAVSLAVSLDGGSYAVAGEAAALKLSELLVANAGSYDVTGSDVAFFTQTESSIIGSGGAYATTGSDATLFKNDSIIALPGSYELDGKTVSLRKSSTTDGFQTDAFQYLSYQMPFASVSVMTNGGAYAVAGTDASLRLSSTKVALDGGSYAVTGSDAALDTRWYALAETGSYAVTGAVAALIRPTNNGYVFVWMGDDWREKPVRVWTGTEWRAYPVKFYRNGWRLA